MSISVVSVVYGSVTLLGDITRVALGIAVSNQGNVGGFDASIL